MPRWHVNEKLYSRWCAYSTLIKRVSSFAASSAACQRGMLAAHSTFPRVVHTQEFSLSIKWTGIKMITLSVTNGTFGYHITGSNVISFD